MKCEICGRESPPPFIDGGMTNLDHRASTLASMRQASSLVDDAVGQTEYNLRLVALALMARQYLRELP